MKYVIIVFVFLLSACKTASVDFSPTVTQPLQIMTIEILNYDVVETSVLRTAKQIPVYQIQHGATSNVTLIRLNLTGATQLSVSELGSQLIAINGVLRVTIK